MKHDNPASHRTADGSPSSPTGPVTGLSTSVLSPTRSEGSGSCPPGTGISPRWSHNGDEIFYLGADGMMWSVDVVDRTRFTTGERRALFSYEPYESTLNHQE